MSLPIFDMPLSQEILSRFEKNGSPIVPASSPYYQQELAYFTSQIQRDIQNAIDNYNRSPNRRGLVVDVPESGTVAADLARKYLAGEIRHPAEGGEGKGPSLYDSLLQSYVQPFDQASAQVQARENASLQAQRTLPGQPLESLISAETAPGKTFASEGGYTAVYDPVTNSYTYYAPGETVPVQDSGMAQSTGDPKYDQLLQQLETYLAELQKRGKVLNPNIELSDKVLAEFTKKAEGEINPYYAGQLKLARETLLRGQGYTTDDIVRSEQDLERKYGKAVRQIGESAAEQGFALSGRRRLEEQELAGETQRAVEQNRRQLGFQAGTQALEFAKQFGSRELPQAHIQEAPQVIAGESVFKKGERTLPFYSVSPSVLDGIVGEQEFQRGGAIRTRASELESAQRTLEGIKQQRQLNL